MKNARVNEDLRQPSNALQHQIFSGDSPGLVETTNVDSASEGNPKRFRTKDCYRQIGRMINLGQHYTPNLDSATNEAFTASDNSIGSSGGTTLVMTKIQSSNNFDFLRFLSIPAGD